MSVLVFIVQRGVGTESRAGSRDVFEGGLTEFGEGLVSGRRGTPRERVALGCPWDFGCCRLDWGSC